MNAAIANRLIARAVRGGQNDADARELLAEQVRVFAADLLEAADALPQPEDMEAPGVDA